MKNKILIYEALVSIVLLGWGSFDTNAQSIDFGRFSGSFSLEAQTYKQDSIINAPKVPEQILSNGYLNLNYTNSNISMGLRYENYFNPLLGIDPRYKGQGIAYRYVSYNTDFIDVTAGNYYEQFGSGLIFRSYEERALGYDNAMDGARVRVRPIDGVSITGIIGKQRNFWDESDGIVRGADINLNLANFITSLGTTNIFTGVSVISTYQADKDLFLKMPENALAWSARAGVATSSMNFDVEYAYKNNNPSATNEYNYNSGYGAIINFAFFESGYSASLNLHKIDNMDFRSDRYAQGTQLMLGFVPPLTKQHTYRLASMYPFATKFNGEAGMQLELAYKIPKGSAIGGKYGTDLTLNYSRVHNIDTTHTYKNSGINTITGRTYKSDFFSIGDRLYFQDINFNISRKFNPELKATATYINLIYDKDILENEGVPNSGKVYANILVADGTYRISSRHAIKLELQHMWEKQDSSITSHDLINGNWFGVMAELTISPNWYISIFDDWNYGNNNTDRQVHYFNSSVAYTRGSSRFSLGYGKQRSGVLCVGGVCRQVPASNGLYLSISTSF